MDFTLLKEGFFVMVIGMGTVFVFLVIMIYAMNINSAVLKFIGKFFPEEVPEENKQTKKKASQNNDEEIALAIACAVQKARA